MPQGHCFVDQPFPVAVITVDGLPVTKLFQRVHVPFLLEIVGQTKCVNVVQQPMVNRTVAAVTNYQVNVRRSLRKVDEIVRRDVRRIE